MRLLEYGRTHVLIMIPDCLLLDEAGLHIGCERSCSNIFGACSHVMARGNQLQAVPAVLLFLLQYKDTAAAFTPFTLFRLWICGCLLASTVQNSSTVL